MPTGELITEFGSSHLTSDGFDDCILVVGGENDSVDVIVGANALEDTGLVVVGYSLLEFLKS